MYDKVYVKTNSKLLGDQGELSLFLSTFTHDLLKCMSPTLIYRQQSFLVASLPLSTFVPVLQKEQERLRFGLRHACSKTRVTCYHILPSSVATV